ncbi:MAG: hypothetical protein UV58_C0013G0013 [Candidatus Wolfebacteria bacterium GW2011_GWC1_43_10]|uniref:Uncharacterized protein n=1 Tax=Candidatus Wolfebacteria bacterium GW2011_GWC1_43_10 TaxID=1619011 RepID=A0A0G1C8T3_9BACT|nr:MAG: hypothetical protein UV58_C0013G0013 [Candidatus Wolfebacteria bacterium GW2011_GWC1_43_10]HZX13024.1 hypothetical protein [Thermodesulfobacteriota bacterium]
MWKPNYLYNGFKTKEEAKAGVFNYLLKHQQAIVNHGFSNEVMFTMGDMELILHGKGRDLDKAKAKAKD